MVDTKSRNYSNLCRCSVFQVYLNLLSSVGTVFIKRPARDACLCMGELQALPAPHFVFLITL